MAKNSKNKLKFKVYFATTPKKTISYRCTHESNLENCQIKEREKLYSFNNPLDIIDQFRSSHIDCQLGFDVEYVDTFYGIIYGWRDATEEEKNVIRQSILKNKEEEKYFKQRRIEETKKILKEAGEL